MGRAQIREVCCASHRSGRCMDVKAPWSGTRVVAMRSTTQHTHRLSAQGLERTNEEVVPTPKGSVCSSIRVSTWGDGHNLVSCAVFCPRSWPGQQMWGRGGVEQRIINN